MQSGAESYKDADTGTRPISLLLFNAAPRFWLQLPLDRRRFLCVQLTAAICRLLLGCCSSTRTRASPRSGTAAKVVCQTDWHSPLPVISKRQKSVVMSLKRLSWQVCFRPPIPLHSPLVPSCVRPLSPLSPLPSLLSFLLRPVPIVGARIGKVTRLAYISWRTEESKVVCLAV